MERFERTLGAVTKYLDYLSRVGFFVLMALVTINVILRYGWTSISGTYDYVQLITAVSVAAAVAFTAYERGNIEIELLMERFSQRVQAVVASIVTLVCIGFFVLATWRLVVLAHDMQVAGETTMTVYVPFAPFLYFIAFGFALMILAMIAQLVRQVMKVVRPEAGKTQPAAESAESDEIPPEVFQP
jgi:TRAP-type C4-dicarboxylate transport system permease small subunit